MDLNRRWPFGHVEEYGPDGGSIFTLPASSSI